MKITEFNKVPRGRENMNQNTRRTMTGSSLMMNPRSRTNLAGIPVSSSAILSPVFPSPTRPRTAPASPTISSSPLASRPGTADSIRHHRLDSIRASGQGHRTPTRESSPSRHSVRFVEHHGGDSNGPIRDSNGGKNVVVLELPPSFSNRDGKTLVDSPVEGESSK